jgi:hypothetical protein
MHLDSQAQANSLATMSPDMDRARHGLPGVQAGESTTRSLDRIVDEHASCTVLWVVELTFPRICLRKHTGRTPEHGPDVGL